jgi:hypothetical protein
MRNLVYLLLSITLASPLSALALGIDNPDYDQCVLQSLRNSQSSMAARDRVLDRRHHAGRCSIFVYPIENTYAIKSFAIDIRQPLPHHATHEI